MVQTIFNTRDLIFTSESFSEMNLIEAFALIKEDLLMESLILAQSERWRRA